MPDSDLLEVVDENDQVVGLETRVKIHAEGLLHRDVHVWFITPRAEVIFQLRSKNKDAWPNKLTAAVGGHVDPNMSYEECAIKECGEETGLMIKPEDLVFMSKAKKSAFDPATGTKNNHWRKRFAYLYEGDWKDLHIEEGEAVGFEVWPIHRLNNLTEEERVRFVPACIEPDMLEFFQKAKEIFKLN